MCVYVCVYVCGNSFAVGGLVDIEDEHNVQSFPFAGCDAGMGGIGRRGRGGQ